MAQPFKNGAFMKTVDYSSYLYDDNFFVKLTKFDWFCAGVDCDIVLFVENFKKFFDCDVEDVPPRNGYRYAIRLVRGSHVFALVMYGGDNVGSRLYVQASGYESNALRDYLVIHYPDSVLIRADICLDIDEPDVFKSLFELLCRVSTQFRLNTNSVGDWVNEVGGRTFYVGSRQSPAYCRLYEKGKQLLVKNPDYVRLELECKPKNGDSRYHWFSRPASDFWGFNAWTASLFSQISGLGILPSSVKPGIVHRDSSHDRAMHFLIRQYRQTIQNELHYNGGDYILLINRLLGVCNE